MAQLPQPSQTWDWATEENLISIAFGRPSKALPHVEHTCSLSEQGDKVLASGLERNFTLVAEDEDGPVNFDVHTAWVLGTSEVLVEYIHPGKVTNPNPPKTFLVPSRFGAAMVARMVDHMCKGAYMYPKDIPDNNTAMEIADMQIHLHMYSVGEYFEHRPLMATAYTHLVELLLQRGLVQSGTLMAFVNIVYASGEQEVCKDGDGLLRRLAVVAVVARSKRYWHGYPLKAFLAQVNADESFKAECERMSAVVQKSNGTALHATRLPDSAKTRWASVYDPSDSPEVQRAKWASVHYWRRNRKR